MGKTMDRSRYREILCSRNTMSKSRDTEPKVTYEKKQMKRNTGARAETEKDNY
jgi:hypothetical protein